MVSGTRAFASRLASQMLAKLGHGDAGDGSPVEVPVDDCSMSARPRSGRSRRTCIRSSLTRRGGALRGTGPARCAHLGQQILDHVANPPIIGDPEHDFKSCLGSCYHAQLRIAACWHVDLTCARDHGSIARPDSIGKDQQTVGISGDQRHELGLGPLPVAARVTARAARAGRLRWRGVAGRHRRADAQDRTKERAVGRHR